jgi:heme oxygenase
MQSVVPSVMLRLKEATQELHTRAERSEFQQRLMRGTVPRDLYAQWLGQLLLVHAALESRLVALRDNRPDLAVLIRDELFQAPRLREDLAFLGLSPDTIRPTPAVERIVAQMADAARACPASLLGSNYVLEGSKNGSRYIAKAVRRALPLTPGEGDRYLDPHGEDQPRLWAEYRRTMDEALFTEDETLAMIDAASRMFEAAEGIGADLLARDSAGAGSR